MSHSAYLTTEIKEKLKCEWQKIARLMEMKCWIAYVDEGENYAPDAS